MKHLAITTPLAVRRQKPQASLRHHKGVLAGGTFKDVAVDPFTTMRIKKPHKIEGRIFACTYGAGLSNKFPGAVFDSRNITRAHICLLRLPLTVVQHVLAFNEVESAAFSAAFTDYQKQKS